MASRVLQAVIPSMNEFIAPPTVRCFAYARGTTYTDRGARGRSPHNAATSTPPQTTQNTSVGGLRPLRPSRTPAPASAGGVSKSHFA